MFKGFQKPKRLVANTETLTERYGMFIAQPFERGFGSTIGTGQSQQRSFLHSRSRRRFSCLVSHLGTRQHSQCPQSMQCFSTQVTCLQTQTFFMIVRVSWLGTHLWTVRHSSSSSLSAGRFIPLLRRGFAKFGAGGVTAGTAVILRWIPAN